MYLGDVNTLYKMIFNLKFLSLTVKVGQNNIDSIKIVMNLLTELELYLKRYLRRN